MFFLVWFTYKDPFPLYKSSQRKNHLKSREFWDTFLLSALKMSITSVTSYQAGKKILKKRSLTPLAAVYSSFKVQMCSYVIVGNKIFCYFKKRVFGRCLGKKGMSSIFHGGADILEEAILGIRINRTFFGAIAFSGCNT